MQAPLGAMRSDGCDGKEGEKGVHTQCMAKVALAGSSLVGASGGVFSIADVVCISACVSGHRLHPLGRSNHVRALVRGYAIGMERGGGGGGALASRSCGEVGWAVVVAGGHRGPSALLAGLCWRSLAVYWLGSVVTTAVFAKRHGRHGVLRLLRANMARLVPALAPRPPATLSVQFGMDASRMSFCIPQGFSCRAPEAAAMISTSSTSVPTWFLGVRLCQPFAHQR